MKLLSVLILAGFPFVPMVSANAADLNLSLPAYVCQVTSKFSDVIKMTLLTANIEHSHGTTPAAVVIPFGQSLSSAFGGVSNVIVGSLQENKTFIATSSDLKMSANLSTVKGNAQIKIEVRNGDGSWLTLVDAVADCMDN